MEIPRWFDRTFPDKPPLEAFPFVIERLRGAPARIEERTAGLASDLLARRAVGAWSIQEHVGHLGDLEPLWFARLDDLISGQTELRPADLTNRRTHQAEHNRADLPSLLGVFRAERQRFVDRLDNMDSAEAGLTALHPRLKQPMRLIDHCHFVADHDDHHMALISAMLRIAQRG
jgi:uncharacterized damage-inducible protein DinB